MKLVELYAEEFGCFVDRRFALGEGLNLIEGANESGKSTLQALIRFLFYGFPRRAGEEGEERYKRISQRTRRAAGSVTFLWHGSRYFLYRDYVLHTSSGRELPAERVTVTGEGGEAVDLGGKTPGEYFLMLPASLYHGSVCVKESEIERVADPEMGHTVTEMLFSDMGGAGRERAEKILDEARRVLWHNRGTGGRIAVLQEQLADLEAAQAIASENATRLAVLRKECAHLRAALRERESELATTEQMRAAVQLDAELARFDAWRAAVADTEKKHAAWQSALRENKTSAKTHGLARKKGIFATVSALSIVLALLFAISALGGNAAPARLVPTMACIALAVLFALLWRKTARALRVLQAKLLRQEGEMRLCYEAAKSAGAVLENGIEPANEHALRARRAALPAPDADSITLDNRHALLQKATHDLREALAAAEREEVALAATAQDPAALLTQRNEIFSALTGAKNRLLAIKMASEALREADKTLREGVLPRLAARASTIFEKLTNGAWHTLHIGDGFAVSVGTARGSVPLSHFSAGCRDAAHLALRVALTDLITSEPLPLLFDEVTARLDDTRTARLLSLLESFCLQGGQCLLFTCHTREAKMLAGGVYTHIVL